MADPQETSGIRLYVGGISENIRQDDFEKTFNQFGDVTSVDIIRHKGIAYIQIDNTNKEKISQCLSAFRNVKWKGQKIVVEKAKPDYLSALKKNWEEEEEKRKEWESRRLKEMSVGKDGKFRPPDPTNWVISKRGKFDPVLKLGYYGRRKGGFVVNPHNQRNALQILHYNLKPLNVESIWDMLEDMNDISKDKRSNNQSEGEYQEEDLVSEAVEYQEPMEYSEENERNLEDHSSEENEHHSLDNKENVKSKWEDEIIETNKQWSYSDLVLAEDKKIFEVAESQDQGFGFLSELSETPAIEHKDDLLTKNVVQEEIQPEVVVEEAKFLPIFSFMFVNTQSKKKRSRESEDHLHSIITLSESFRRHKSVDEVKEDWRNKRSFLRKDAKKKHKFSVKRMRSHK